MVEFILAAAQIILGMGTIVSAVLVFRASQTKTVTDSTTTVATTKIEATTELEVKKLDDQAVFRKDLMLELAEYKKEVTQLRSDLLTVQRESIQQQRDYMKVQTELQQVSAQLALAQADAKAERDHNVQLQEKVRGLEETTQRLGQELERERRSKEDLKRQYNSLAAQVREQGQS